MIPFVAIGPGPDYPAVADVEQGVQYDFGNLTGALIVGGGGGGGGEDISDYFESATLIGGLSLLDGINLLLAANVGVTAQPSSATETFRYIDGSLAFTTTFDINGNRTSVDIE